MSFSPELNATCREKTEDEEKTEKALDRKMKKKNESIQEATDRAHRLFNSADGDRFLTSTLPSELSAAKTLNHNEENMISKDDTLMSYDYGSIFDSKEVFSTCLGSDDWDLNFHPSPPRLHEDPARIHHQQPKEASSFPPSEEFVTNKETKGRGSTIFHEMPMDTIGNHLDISFSCETMFGGSDCESEDDADGAMPDHQLPPPSKFDWEGDFLSQLQPYLPVPGDEDSDVEGMEFEYEDIPDDDSSTEHPPPKEELPLTTEEWQKPAADVPLPAMMEEVVKQEEPGSNDVPVVAEVTATTKKTPKRKRKRAPRKKVVPDKKIYVDPAGHDVLLGRGGRSNHHPGNKRYREEVKNLKLWYKDVEDKDEKTRVSQCLVDYVHSYDGRFLEMDKVGWFIVPNIVARRKASQALRENNDPAQRAAKRARYMKKKKNEETEEASTTK